MHVSPSSRLHFNSTFFAEILLRCSPTIVRYAVFSLKCTLMLAVNNQLVFSSFNGASCEKGLIFVLFSFMLKSYAVLKGKVAGTRT